MFKTKNPESTLDTNLTIGQTLRTAREAQGLSRAEISRDCKLQERFLEAVESGHTCELPSHIYFRMFARTYAESLKLDADQLLGRLYPELPQPEFAPARNPAEHAQPLDPDEEQLAQVLTGEPAGQPGTASIQPPAPATHAPVGVNPYPVSPAAYGQVTGWRPYSGAPGGSKTGMNIGVALSANRAVVSRLALGILAATLLFIIGKFVVINYGLAQPSPADPVEATAETALEQAGIPAYQPRGMLELTIRALDKTAVLVIADGVTLFDRELQEGETLTWKSNSRFKINVANKSKVEMFIGGQMLKEPSGAGKTLNHFEINQLNYQGLLRDDREVKAVSSGGD